MGKQEILEIKKGQTGRGLLIENDGYTSLDLSENKRLVESFGIGDGKRLSPKELPNPFIVSAVFQKFGIENANGRVYPEGVLKSAVEKYMSEIEARKAYGECYTPDVLILSESGWKRLGDIKEGENILTLNTDNGEIEIKPVLKKIEYEYSGEMVRIKGRNINDLVTPNHKFPIFNRNKKFDGFYTAENILNRDIKSQSHCYIPKTGKWTGCGDKEFILKGIENPSKRQLSNHPDCASDVAIPIEQFMKFMGIYLSEGSVRKTRNSNDVNIAQKKEEVCFLIEELLNEMPFEWKSTEFAGKKTYTICDPRLKRYLEQFGDCYSKYVPMEVKRQSRENLRIFYDWFVLGDGRVRGDKRSSKKLTDDVFSVSERMCMDLNEIQLKIGYCGSYHVENRENMDRYIGERLIEGKNSKPMHFTLRSLSDATYLDERFISVSKEKYSGPVACVEVENHTWFVMSDGKCHWTGNCNHPEGSNINVINIAINIVELHWEGHTLVGKMEIPISEGFRNLGIISCSADMVAQWLISGLRLGVSSRGLGSVEKHFGQLVVGDDYEIVCWDVVAQPSTPQAYIGLTDSELAPYVEGKASKENTITESKYDKFEKWLTD